MIFWLWMIFASKFEVQRGTRFIAGIGIVASALIVLANQRCNSKFSSFKKSPLGIGANFRAAS